MISRHPIPLKQLWLLAVLAGLLTAPWACSTSSNPAAPGPVTILELVTATLTSTPTPSPTSTPGGAPTSTPVPPPAVINGYFSTSENLPVTLSNATLNTLVTSDPNGDPLIFIFPGSPGNGTVSLTHVGYTNTITYTPNAGFYGVDSFAYYAHDQATNEDSTVQTMVITVAFVPTATFTPTVTSTPTITWTPTNTSTPTFTPTPNATDCPTRGFLGPNDPGSATLVGAGDMVFNLVNPSGLETLWSLDVNVNTNASGVSLQCAAYDQATGTQLALSAPQSVLSGVTGVVKYPVTPCTLVPGRTYLLVCNVIAGSGLKIEESNTILDVHFASNGGSPLPANYTGAGATNLPTVASYLVYGETCP
jgi:hypothetical protein